MSPDMPVRNPDAVSKWILALHDTYGLTYRQIQQKPYFSQIPAGTICAIAKGYPVPNKYRKMLGMYPLVKVPANMVRKSCPQAHPDRRNRRAINLNDAVSAAATIIGAGVSKDYLDRLSELLRLE